MLSQCGQESTRGSLRPAGLKSLGETLQRKGAVLHACSTDLVDSFGELLILQYHTGAFYWCPSGLVHLLYLAKGMTKLLHTTQYRCLMYSVWFHMISRHQAVCGSINHRLTHIPLCLASRSRPGHLLRRTVKLAGTWPRALGKPLSSHAILIHKLAQDQCQMPSQRQVSSYHASKGLV